MSTNRRTTQRKNKKTAKDTTKATRARSTQPSKPADASVTTETPTERKLTRKRPMAPLILRAPRQPTHQEIAERAFELFERRSGDDGDDTTDWLKAESDLLGNF